MSQAPASMLIAPNVSAEIAEDLRTLAWLHAAERDSATWKALHQAGFPSGVVLLAQQDAALLAMADALQQLEVSAEQDDWLAADFAAIYLTHALRASPCESVWRDEDHLMWQTPTFEMRRLYRQHDLAVSDWRSLPDDHLSHELAFLAHLMERGELTLAAELMGKHLLVWVPEFVSRVAHRADTVVYAALALMTGAGLRQLRQVLRVVEPETA